MNWGLCLPALVALGIAAIDPLGAQAPDGQVLILIRSLDLAKTSGVALKRYAAGQPNLAQCFDRIATPQRLEADLLPVVAQAGITPEAARPILAFLASPTGRKFAAAVPRREPEFKQALRRPIILPGGVPMGADEVTSGEVGEIRDFMSSPQGAPLLKLLQATTGFGQLTQNLAQRKSMAAECGLQVK